jgi:hypothetical protein
MHKAKGQVLTHTTTQETVEGPPYTQPYEAPKGSEMGHVEDGAVQSAEPLAPYCEIGFEAGMTHNMTNMEFVKVTVSIKIPCLVPEIDEAFEYAKSWVDQKLNLVNAEIKGE